MRRLRVAHTMSKMDAAYSRWNTTPISSTRRLLASIVTARLAAAGRRMEEAAVVAAASRPPSGRVQTVSFDLVLAHTTALRVAACRPRPPAAVA